MNQQSLPVTSPERPRLSSRLVNYEGSILALIALATGTVWRLWGLGRPSFWLDEFITYWIISAGTWNEFWVRSTSYTATPPLYFALERLVHATSGFDEFWLRFPSVAFDIAAIVVLFGFVRAAVGARAAGISALLYAWTTSLVYHARIARPYSMAILLAELSMWLLWRALRQPERLRLWLLYSLATVALIYTQFIFAPLLLAQLLWVFFAPHHEFRRHGLRLAAAQLAVGASVLPLLGQIGRLWNDRASLEWGTASAGADRLAQFFQPGAVVIAGLGWLVVWWCRCERDQRIDFFAPRHELTFLGFLLAWALVPALVMWGLSIRMHATLSETRYLLAYAPACTAILGLAASWIRPAATRGVVILLYLVASPQIAQIRELMAHGYATLVTYDYRPALEKLAREYAPADLVLVRTGMPESRLLDQRWNDLSLHGYLATPLSVISRSDSLNVRAVPDHWSDREIGQHLRDLLVASAARGGSVWVISHDGLGAGNRAYESIATVLRRRGWTVVDAQFLEGELVGIYRVLDRDTPSEPNQDGQQHEP